MAENSNSSNQNDSSIFKTVVHHSILDKYTKQPNTNEAESKVTAEPKKEVQVEVKKEPVISPKVEVKQEQPQEKMQEPTNKVQEVKHNNMQNKPNNQQQAKPVNNNQPKANSIHVSKKETNKQVQQTNATKPVANAENANVTVHKEHKRNNRRLPKSTGPVLAEKVIEIKRISKTTKGGRRLRFSALVVVGDKKGQIGYGLAKANEVPDALKKAIKKANNNLVKVKMTKRGTLYHEVIGHSSSGEVLLKPAPEGTGLIAGGAIRAVIELAGYSDIYSKNKGTNSSINMVRATINGLMMQRNPKDVATARDLPIDKIFR